MTALGEAIDIIRGIWDASAPGLFRLDGEHYRISGTQRGPRPAHDISIWVPAAGPACGTWPGARPTARSAAGCG